MSRKNYPRRQSFILRLRAFIPDFKPVSVGRPIYRAGLNGIAAIERGRREKRG